MYIFGTMGEKELISLLDEYSKLRLKTVFNYSVPYSEIKEVEKTLLEISTEINIRIAHESWNPPTREKKKKK